MFGPDPRNRERQGYCRRPGCQRLRRALAQRARRQKVPTRQTPSRHAAQSRRRQAASGISEVDLRLENPAIIGLISMITGSTDLESIQQVYRQCWRRGLEILAASGQATAPNSAIIRLLEEVRKQAQASG